MSYIYASTAAEQYARLFEKAMEEGVRHGIEAAQAEIEKRRTGMRKNRFDKRLHNTKLLLRNFRSLKAHACEALSDAKEAQKRSKDAGNAIDILDDIEDTAFSDHVYIDTIRQSQQRTLIIISHIEKMYELYEIMAERSKKPEKIRAANVTRDLYLVMEEMTPDEVADKYIIDRRTVSRDVTATIEDLTPLIFGVDSLAF